MSLESNDKLAEWIELSYRNGVREEQARILRLLFETQISVPTEGLTERDSEAMQHALFQFTLKLAGLIRGENEVSGCCNCCKDPVCLGCGDCDDVECQTIREENKPTECICDPCDSNECECYGKRCEYCKTQD